MAKRLRGRHDAYYMFTPPHTIDEMLWRNDVELMALVEEAQALERLFERMRMRVSRSHVPQWGRITEDALRVRVLSLLRGAEEERRLATIVNHVRRLRRGVLRLS